MSPFFRNLNKLVVLTSLTGVVVLLGMSSCKKKDRLAASTYTFAITPPAAAVAKASTLALTARGVSNGHLVTVDPTWEIAPSSVATLSSSIGQTVTLQPVALGDVLVTATFDGMAATSQIAIVTYVPSANTFDVYNDIGIPANSTIFTERANLPDPAPPYLAQIATGYTPEGNNYQRVRSIPNGYFWGVDVVSRDLSEFAVGTLKFSIKLDQSPTAWAGATLIINVNDTGAIHAYTLVNGSDGFDSTSGAWQEISLNLATRFPTLNLSVVKVPFAIIKNGPQRSYSLDAVRWEK